MKRKYLDLVNIAPRLITVNIIIFIPFIIISFLKVPLDNRIPTLIKRISLVCSGVMFLIIAMLIIYEQIQDKYFRFGKKEPYWIKTDKGLFECPFCGYRQNNCKAESCSSCGKDIIIQ